MKKLFKLFKIVHINVFIYRMTHFQAFENSKFNYKIEEENVGDKFRYYIFDEEQNQLIHESFLFNKVFLLKIINKNGPVIGDCFTNKLYRGKSIYPSVINYIASSILLNKNSEVFIIVNQDNLSSIRGIEKAKFIKHASINSKRWLLFYFNKTIKFYD